MPIAIAPFTTTASITGSTLISNADDQLNILMNDVENYVESTYQTVATNLEGTVGIHVTTASNFASQAEASAASALNSADGADVSEANALSYKNSAQMAASNASTSEANALSYKNSAEASADSAAVSAYDASVNATTIASHLANNTNPHNVTASQVGLGNVTNISDYAKPVIGFTLDNTVTPSVGQIAWNQNENTLDVGLNGATLQLGQEQLIRVRNTTASTITNGTAVMATGTIGNSGRITVAPANITHNNAKFILGVVTESIAAGADGFCTVFGKVRGINTSGSIYGETWADGDTIYVKPSDSGTLTNVEPTSTQVKLPIAIVISAHASTGTLFIRVTPIDENHAEAGLASKVTKGDNILVNTTGLDNMTSDHRIQVDGYVGHKIGWRDLVAPFSTTSSGVAAPTLTTLSNGVRLYRFDTGDSVHASYHVDHDYAEGTLAYHHIHWFPETAIPAGQSVTWRIYYIVAKGHAQGESLLGTRSFMDITYTSPVGGTIAGNHIVTEASDAQAYSIKEPDTVILAEIELLSKTFAGNVIGIQADLHYLSDREVTVSKKPNFNVAI